MAGITVSRAAVRVLSAVTLLVVIPIVHLGLPWLLAQWSPRWGWTEYGPGAWNFIGPIIMAFGLALLIWILQTALGQIYLLPERVQLGLRPARLLTMGPYAISRHPMYLAESFLWLGVAVFFGSPLVLAVIVLGGVIVGRVIIPREERALKKYFGDEYRRYCERVPPFVGKA